MRKCEIQNTRTVSFDIQKKNVTKCNQLNDVPIYTISQTKQIRGSKQNVCTIKARYK